MTETVFVILRHTGEYSDYTCRAICYVDSEEIGQMFVKHAELSARNIADRLSKLRQRRDAEIEKCDDDEYLVVYDKYQALIRKVQSPYDDGLDEYDLYDVTYTVQGLAKWVQQ